MASHHADGSQAYMADDNAAVIFLVAVERQRHRSLSHIFDKNILRIVFDFAFLSSPLDHARHVVQRPYNDLNFTSLAVRAAPYVTSPATYMDARVFLRALNCNQLTSGEVMELIAAWPKPLQGLLPLTLQRLEEAISLGVPIAHVPLAVHAIEKCSPFCRDATIVAHARILLRLHGTEGEDTRPRRVEQVLQLFDFLLLPGREDLLVDQIDAHMVIREAARTGRFKTKEAVV